MNIIDDLKTLQQMFLKEALGYAKQGKVPDGARPNEITPWQQCCGNIAGTYRVAAHEIGKIIKKHDKPCPTDSQEQ